MEHKLPEYLSKPWDFSEVRVTINAGEDPGFQARGGRT